MALSGACITSRQTNGEQCRAGLGGERIKTIYRVVCSPEDQPMKNNVSAFAFLSKMPPVPVLQRDFVGAQAIGAPTIFFYQSTITN
jgi:hypothetical protein